MGRRCTRWTGRVGTDGRNNLRRARKKRYHFLLSDTSVTAPLEKKHFWGLKRCEGPNWDEGRKSNSDLVRLEATGHREAASYKRHFPP